jgi:glycosyltransferase involved in cell wall biosynthesis
MKGKSLMRTGLLAEELTSRGHDVLWWGTNFYHLQKEMLSPGEEDRHCGERLTVRLLQALPYKKNLSYRRYLHHKHLARRFVHAAANEKPPHVIMSSLPVHNLTYEAVRYGKSRGVPVIVDVRDLWPDVFVDAMPVALKPAGRFFLRGDFKQTAFALKHARAIVSTCPSYMQWALHRAGREKSSEDRIFHLGALPMADLPASEQVARAKFPWFKELEDRLVFGFIGTFGQSYDLGLVVEAARVLHQKNNSHIHFLLGGEGEFYAQVKKLAEGLPNVTFTGWLDRDGSAALLMRAHVGLIPYIKRAPSALPNKITLPNKIAQYMSAGLPILSSLTGDFPALLAEHPVGLNYQGGCVEDFLDAVETLAGQPTLLRQMATEARRVFWEQFNSKVIYQEFANLLENLAVTKGRR